MAVPVFLHTGTRQAGESESVSRFAHQGGRGACPTDYQRDGAETGLLQQPGLN